ncbi:hypothetical protein Tco_1135902 [Tanacetum coccineum]
MLDLLKINTDLFTCDTPLGMIFDEFNRLSGMDDDLFAYEVKIPKPSHGQCVKQQYDDLKNGNLEIYEPRKCYDEYERMFAEAVVLINERLIRMIDITLEQWLDLRSGHHKKVDKEVMKSVVSTWLIRSYKKQFKEYMKIKRQLEVNGIDTYIECDPTNVEFATWLGSKFSNHVTMDWHMKNALWIYWKRGDDEDMLTGDELSNLEENNNSEIPWVDEKPWSEDGTWKEPTKDISHVCKLFRFKSGHVEWPTCKWKDEGQCDRGGDLPGMIRIGNMTYFQDYKWYEGLKDGKLKDEDLKQKAI